jgi:hypothetical protein
MIAELRLETIDQVQAREILGRADPANVRQVYAPHHRHTVELYAGLMSEGRWRHDTGGFMSFDRTGRLFDGHRRCAACIASNAAFRTYVERWVI